MVRSAPPIPSGADGAAPSRNDASRRQLRIPARPSYSSRAEGWMMDGRWVAASLSALLALSTGCGDGDDEQRPTAVPTASATVTPTAGVTPPTRSPAPTGTAPATPTVTASSPTASASPTPSATPGPPEISYFGVARADDLALEPASFDAAGRPVFTRIQGQGMTIVLEARRGSRPLGETAYDPSGGARGVEFLVARPLGDGSPVVCDVSPPMAGGVPGIDPPVFSDQPEVERAIDDLGCRVNDGTGAPLARVGPNACTRMDPSFEYGFVDATSERQYCLPIARAWNFALGDTIVAARVRDVTGAVSAVREIVVRVQRELPFTCDEGLGERAFTVRRPPSRLVTSATSADASADPWLGGVLRICAGRAVGDGAYQLSLREDAEIGLALADGGTLCARISARGSSGNLDCDGGSAADVRAAQDADGATRIAVDSGLGLDAGTGAATLRAPIAFVQLPVGSTPGDCQAAVYPPSFNGALTTATGTAQVLARDGEAVAEASATGVSFDCSAWRDGGAGTLVLPFPIADTPAGAVPVLAD